jgi:hypothetical protein
VAEGNECGAPAEEEPVALQQRLRKNRRSCLKVLNLPLTSVNKERWRADEKESDFAERRRRAFCSSHEGAFFINFNDFLT